jgi:5-methylcytosine-specific restriction endonuclease McrA
MWSVNRPARTAAEAFSVSVSRVRNPAARQNLQNISPQIVTAAAIYSTTAIHRTLHMFPAQQNVGVILGNELVKTYTQRFAGKKGPGRYIYDEIKALPKGDRCPYCDQRDVSTLDHVLPKAHYPILAVTPDNLVGSCVECNKAKDDHQPATSVDTFLHPYFEDISQEQWLKASVVEELPCAVRFSAIPPLHWNADLRQRLIRQFQALDLAKLYGSQAAREMSDIRASLHHHFAAGGQASVRSELIHQWDSRRLNQTNSWRTALYESLKDSVWFCSGGFQHE